MFAQSNNCGQLWKSKKLSSSYNELNSLQRYTWQNITEASPGLPQALNMENSATIVKKF